MIVKATTIEFMGRADFPSFCPLWNLVIHEKESFSKFVSKPLPG
jgi:hypothetical protein